MAKAGASFEFIISRRTPGNPDKGVVFLTPIKGTKQQRAASEAANSLHSVRVEGLDRPGLGIKMTRELADAGINLRGLPAAALGRRSVAYFAFDSADDAANAIKLLKKVLK
ncbi:MAG: amino acid-binding protein [Deltaproteobacteria bacterium]|nr:amino acid-binding protein [Deltaproteobacteria bacterium]